MLALKHPKTNLLDLTADLKFEFSDMADDLAAHYLLRAARYMCRSGDLVRHTNVIHTQPGIENYLLEADDDSDVWAILNVRPRSGGVCVERILRLREEPHLPVRGTAVWLEAPRTIHIRQLTGFYNKGCYDVEFSTIPAKDACAIDDRLAVENYETLLNGARWFIHGVSGKPWFSLDVAALYEAKFKAGIQAAKLFDLSGRQRGTQMREYGRLL
jgi:hypothetical protein